MAVLSQKCQIDKKFRAYLLWNYKIILTKRKKLQGVLLDYICENDSKNELLDLNKILDIQKIRQNRQNINELLILIKSIIDNHHHHSHFFSKIEQILHILKDAIKTIDTIYQFNYKQ